MRKVILFAIAMLTVIITTTAGIAKSMYIPGEGSIGILYANSGQSFNGINVISNSGIGLKTEYFLFPNLSVSSSWIYGSWTGAGMNGPALEYSFGLNYDYPFAKISNAPVAALFNIGYTGTYFGSPTTGGAFAISPTTGGNGLTYGVGLDTRMGNIQGYVLYKLGSISPVSTMITQPALNYNSLEVGITYVYDMFWFLRSDDSSDSDEEDGATE